MEPCLLHSPHKGQNAGRVDAAQCRRPLDNADDAQWPRRRVDRVARPHHCNPGGGTMNFDKELDTRGLTCPLPILKTKKALMGLASGQVLKIDATDPGSIRDVEAFVNQTGHTLLSSAEADGIYTFYLRKR
jgi:tRNA 2-thiouridine synthesizing protein A